MARPADLIVPFPQQLVAVRADRSALAGLERIWQEVEAAEAKLGEDGRVVRAGLGHGAGRPGDGGGGGAAPCAAVCDHLVGIVAGARSG